MKNIWGRAAETENSVSVLEDEVPPVIKKVTAMEKNYIMAKKKKKMDDLENHMRRNIRIVGMPQKVQQILTTC